MRSEVRARAIGERLLAQVRQDHGGGEWKLRVWENLGWHCCVVTQWWSIHPNFHNNEIYGYTAFLRDKGMVDRGDLQGGHWAESGDTPRDAMANTLAVAREDVEGKAAGLNGGEGDFQPRRAIMGKTQ